MIVKLIYIPHLLIPCLIMIAAREGVENHRMSDHHLINGLSLGITSGKTKIEDFGFRKFVVSLPLASF